MNAQVEKRRDRVVTKQPCDFRASAMIGIRVGIRIRTRPSLLLQGFARRAELERRSEYCIHYGSLSPNDIADYKSIEISLFLES